MSLQIKDISSFETLCFFDKRSFCIETFFGSAICLDFSNIHHTDIIDVYKVKDSIELNKSSISSGDTVLLYTGHSDRFYNTSLWRSRRSFITLSALDYLASLGVKNLCIDAPFFIKNVISFHPDMALTVSLANIGHLVNRRFIYFGFPVPSRELGFSPTRACVLLKD